MIELVHGNLLEAEADALVNTVNTVGVMGKGIALMFKEAFPENFRAYAAACKINLVQVGHMFVTERRDWVGGPRWIVNFPTKQHWRNPSKLEWIETGLNDLKSFIMANDLRSIALPPLGSGNGGLDWRAVHPVIERALGSIPGVRILVYEPTTLYRNVAKKGGAESLTPARALVAELLRRYSILGFECTLLEIHKLTYLLEQCLGSQGGPNPLRLDFRADTFGPYAAKLNHLLDGLDGSYLHCDKRIADAGVLDVIWFDASRRDALAAYLASEAKSYRPALEAVTEEIAGFESPLGLEILATVDWLLSRDACAPTLSGVKAGLRAWLGGGRAAARKSRLFDDALIDLAIDRVGPRIRPGAMTYPRHDSGSAGS